MLHHQAGVGNAYFDWSMGGRASSDVPEVFRLDGNVLPLRGWIAIGPVLGVVGDHLVGDAVVFFDVFYVGVLVQLLDGSVDVCAWLDGH